jgi:4-hydroxybenzoate polyprenyltransferase
VSFDARFGFWIKPWRDGRRKLREQVERQARAMKLAVAFRLGRVSNLPTVWSNTLAGTVAAGGEPWRLTTLLVAIGISLLYVAGMYLNDAFDREIDARERPERPIPAGQVSADSVFAIGFALTLAGLGFVLWASATGNLQNSWPPMLSGLLLAGAILFYDWNHKGNALSPFFMGLCRVLAYLTAGYAAAAAPASGLYVIALMSLCYLIGLTFIAKQETLDRVASLWPLAFLAAPPVYGFFTVSGGPFLSLVALGALIILIVIAFLLLKRREKGDIPRAVTGLIAGISLADAVYLAPAGNLAVAAAFVCFLATLALQRWIRGT